ncbi:hypothetical protein IV203_009263 [Nitzschia inconspicua]|uniref:Uncharacterized protein n=1 Tax=Nitzschia inconspicua TaxID=303405 RepID=A0A9K3L134_9STRA|nr:hypothetical protein IV203_009263 [Nitzschia inconspicua]
MNERPDSIAVVSGADFFGPGITNLSFLGDTFTKAIVSGSSTGPLLIGSCKICMTFASRKISPTRKLYVAGTDSRADGRFWICPHSIKSKTTQEIPNDIARIASIHKTPKILIMHGWIIRTMGLVDSFIKEMVEMLPIWQQDYTADDSEVFGVEPTTSDVALKETSTRSPSR